VTTKHVKGNACGAKVNLKQQQERNKSTEDKGPVNRGKGSKKKD
jgi:hypothetical protein